MTTPSRSTKVLTTAVTLATALALAFVSSPSVGAPKESTSDSAASLVNEQLVIAQLDPSGLPNDSQLINRLVATGMPQESVSMVTATRGIRYVDQRGGPQVAGEEVTYSVGGAPQTVSTSSAEFEKPLPIALHAEYSTPGEGSRGVNPSLVPGGSGDLAITYTVTNTAVKEEAVTYTDAAGVSHTETQPVFAPFVGALQATLPENLEVTDPGDAIVNTNPTGETTMTWNLVLYPPAGNYEQRLNFKIRSDNLSIPGVAMEVMPVTNGQSPSIGFASELLTGSVDGNQEIAGALTELDIATAKLANGAGELATGQSQLTSGMQSAASSSNQLDEGISQLSKGLGELTKGLDQLSDSSGIPAAQSAAEQIAASVKAIAKKVGNPSDPPLPIPPDGQPILPPDPTKYSLYQYLRLLRSVSGLVAAGSTSLAADLAGSIPSVTEIRVLAQDAKSDSESAKGALDALYEEACDDTATLDPTQCTELQDAIADVDSAATNAGDAATKAVELGGTLVEASARASGIAAATAGIRVALTYILQGVAAISAALNSANPTQVGVYQALNALATSLEKASEATIALASGASAADGGAAEISKGSRALTSGLDELASGSQEIENGLNSLAGGANSLQSEGTSTLLNQVIEASTKPGLADAYLNAASARATEAAPYPAPKGSEARVAYVYSLPGVTPSPNAPIALISIGILALIGASILIARRIRTSPTP